VSASGAVTILLVDDHPVVRAGLRALLAEDGLAVVGEAPGDLARAFRAGALACVAKDAPRSEIVGGPVSLSLDGTGPGP
jgi:hypothetical protein